MVIRSQRSLGHERLVPGTKDQFCSYRIFSMEERLVEVEGGGHFINKLLRLTVCLLTQHLIQEDNLTKLKFMDVRFHIVHST